MQREKRVYALTFIKCVCACVSDYLPRALSFSAADNKHPFIQKACIFGHNSHTFLHLCFVPQITIAKNRTTESEQL